MLQRGLTDYVLVSVPGNTYWGQWVPDMARRFIDKQYGSELARRVVLCESESDTNSTEGEAVELERCLEARGWRSIIVVTSDYHTRRARIIWRRMLTKADPPFQLSVRGVTDDDFQVRAWWRQRRYAKTWLLELTSWFGHTLLEAAHRMSTVAIVRRERGSAKDVENGNPNCVGAAP